MRPLRACQFSLHASADAHFPSTSASIPATITSMLTTAALPPSPASDASSRGLTPLYRTQSAPADRPRAPPRLPSYLFDGSTNASREVSPDAYYSGSTAVSPPASPAARSGGSFPTPDRPPRPLAHLAVHNAADKSTFAARAAAEKLDKPPAKPADKPAPHYRASSPSAPPRAAKAEQRSGSPSAESAVSFDPDGRPRVRGRVAGDPRAAATGTFNQLWSREEQERLIELLEVFPDEEVQVSRFRKIAEALGTRTTRQVASRVQKYFIRLAKLGLPIPGKMNYNYMAYSANNSGAAAARRKSGNGGPKRERSKNMCANFCFYMLLACFLCVFYVFSICFHRMCSYTIEIGARVRPIAMMRATRGRGKSGTGRRVYTMCSTTGTSATGVAPSPSSACGGSVRRARPTRKSTSAKCATSRASRIVRLPHV